MSNKRDNDVRAHITDSLFFRDSYSTQESREIFSDLKRMQRWLDVEIALAESQAELGMLPQSVAKELAGTGCLKNFNVDNIKKDMETMKHSLLPLLKEWKSIVSENAANYIHFGATTQDIQDTAQILEVREVISIVERDLKIIINRLTTLAKKYRNLIMTGRTHTQHAMPITFGLKIAGWLDECMRNAERLIYCKQRILVSELFGAVGTMSAFSENGLALLHRFSKKLGLNYPNVSWHNSRDRFVEFISILAITTGTLGRIANEIIQLSRDEIAELFESFQSGQIGSSTMPQKHNPEGCENIVMLSKLVKNQASLSFDTLISEHERDYRTIRIEWTSITDASLYTACALSLMISILNDVKVDEDQITKNINLFSPVLSTESMMFFLMKKLTKQKAFKYVHEASIKASENKSNFISELLCFSEISDNFTKESLQEIVNPSQSLGSAMQLVDRVVINSLFKFNLNKNIKVDNSDNLFWVITYLDPKEHFKGWLVFDGLEYSLSAGGMRVQKGLQLETLKKMALNMTIKMRLCKLPINGAKAGIDYEPSSVGKRTAVSRFIAAIKPFLETCYSMGPDLNTTMSELSGICIEQDIHSIKMAVAHCQGYTLKYFLERYSILNEKVIGNWELGNLRAGYGVAMNTIRICHHLGLVSKNTLITIQGFGSLAKATIISLLKEGFKIHGIADAQYCVVSKKDSGLPVLDWINTDGVLLPKIYSNNDYDVFERDVIYHTITDIFILAGIEYSITENNVDLVKAKAVIPGANLGVNENAENILYEKKIVVLPSFVAGCGGVASMAGLFSPKNHPSPKDVLEYVKSVSYKAVDEILFLSNKENITPTVAAIKIIANRDIPLKLKPYDWGDS